MGDEAHYATKVVLIVATSLKETALVQYIKDMMLLGQVAFGMTPRSGQGSGVIQIAVQEIGATLARYALQSPETHVWR